MKPKILEWQGHPIIELPMCGKFPFRMGKKKVMAVLMYIPELIEFAKANGDEPPEPNIDSLEALYNLKEDEVPF